MRVCFETRQVHLGHKHGSIATRCSVAEIGELSEGLNRADASRSTPALTTLRVPSVKVVEKPSATPEAPMVCCPMTTRIQEHPFEMPTEMDSVASAVLSDRVKSLDWKVRRAKKKGAAPADVVVHVRAKMKALLRIP